MCACKHCNVKLSLYYWTHRSCWWVYHFIKHRYHAIFHHNLGTQVDWNNRYGWKKPSVQSRSQREGQWCPASLFEICVPPFDVWPHGCCIHLIQSFQNVAPLLVFGPSFWFLTPLLLYPGDGAASVWALATCGQTPTTVTWSEHLKIYCHVIVTQ